MADCDLYPAGFKEKTTLENQETVTTMQDTCYFSPKKLKHSLCADIIQETQANKESSDSLTEYFSASEVDLAASFQETVDSVIKMTLTDEKESCMLNFLEHTKQGEAVTVTQEAKIVEGLSANGIQELLQKDLVTGTLIEELEVKQVVESLESVGSIADSDGVGKNGNEARDDGGRVAAGTRGIPCLKIEVVDDTALIYLPFHNAANVKKAGYLALAEKNRKQKNGNYTGVIGFAKNSGRNADGKKASQRNQSKRNIDGRKDAFLICVPRKHDEKRGAKKLYSRQDLFALRYINVKKQRILWKKVYDELGSVSHEYDDLSIRKHKKMNNGIIGFHPQQGLAVPSVLPGLLPARGRWNHMNMYVH